MITQQDDQNIQRHVEAKVSSFEDFRPALDAAYKIVPHIDAYKHMAAMLLHQLKINPTPDAANLALTCLACGFAFGEDFGQSRFAEALIIGGGR